jgi:hypothetical protein
MELMPLKYFFSGQLLHFSKAEESGAGISQTKALSRAIITRRYTELCLPPTPSFGLPVAASFFLLQRTEGQ